MSQPIEEMPVAVTPCSFPHHPYPSVRRVGTASLPTLLGEFRIAGYRSLTSVEELVALYRGDLLADRAALVRIHSQCLTSEVLGSIRCDCGAQLQRALEMIAAESRGVLVYQLQEGRGIGILNKIRAYALQDEGADTVEANEQLGFRADLREYKQCAEILVDLGLRAVRLMTNNPLKVQAVLEAGLKVVDRVPLEVPPSDSSISYLRSKKYKMGHLICS